MLCVGVVFVVPLRAFSKQRFFLVVGGHECRVTTIITLTSNLSRHSRSEASKVLDLRHVHPTKGSSCIFYVGRLSGGTIINAPHFSSPALPTQSKTHLTMPAIVEGTDDSTSALTRALREASLAGGELPVIPSSTASIDGKGKQDVVEPVTGAAPSPALSEETAASETTAIIADNGGFTVAGADDAGKTAAVMTVEALDPDKPNQRFIDGCPGDLEEAKRRWRNTLQWRKDFGTDGILEKPHKFFDLIKESYPHWYCCEGRTGQPVYYERSGQVVSKHSL